MNNISNSWTIYKLKECFLPITITKKMKSKNYLKHGKFPIIDQGKNLVSGYCDDETMLIKIDTPVIVFGDHTRCFKFVNFNFVAGADGIKILKPKANFDAKLFYYFCQILNFPNKGYARHYQYLIKTDINFPREQAEQNLIVKKIESCFEKIDFAISNFKKSKELIGIYKQSVLSHAFNGKLTNSNLNSWQFKKLGEIISKEKYAMKRGPFGSALKKDFFVENGVRVFEQYNPINQDPHWKRYFITQDKFKELEAFKATGGDLLISCSGTLGKILELPKDVEFGIINQALLKIRLDSNQILNSYFIHYFNSNKFQNLILEKTIGTAIKNIASVAELKKFEIPLPNLQTQAQIVAQIEKRFKAADSALNLIEQNLKKAEILKQSILSKAFNGRLVKDKK